MWVIELILTGLEIVAEIFSSKEKKLEERRRTGKRHNKKTTIRERIRRIDEDPNSAIKWEDIKKERRKNELVFYFVGNLPINRT